jgi:hypothetical protein
MVGDPTRVLRSLAELLDDVGVAYAVGGSLASSQYGEPRATNDVDVLIDLLPARVSAFVKALQKDYDVWEDSVRAALRAGSSFGVLHREDLLKVDFYPATSDLLDRRQLERRRPVFLTGDAARPVFFASPEETSSGCSVSRADSIWSTCGPPPEPSA